MGFKFVIVIFLDFFQEDQQKIEDLRRPTASSQAKCERPWMKRYYVPDFKEKDRHSWSKMDLFVDCHKCMYTQNGTVKNGKKI